MDTFPLYDFAFRKRSKKSPAPTKTMVLWPQTDGGVSESAQTLPMCGYKTLKLKLLSVFSFHHLLCLSFIHSSFHSFLTDLFTQFDLHSVCFIPFLSFFNYEINLLKTKRRPLYLKTQSVPRSKHFSSRL